MRSTSALAIRRVVSMVAMAATLLPLGACAKKSATQPQVGRYTLSGRVQLIGMVVEPDGTVTETRVADDADGVPVELRYGAEVVGRTLTVDGVYRFPGLAPGAYRARSVAFGSIQSETATITVRDADLFWLQPLELRSKGDIFPTPNPSGGDLVVLSFAIADTQFVRLRIHDLGGHMIQSLYGQVLPTGLYESAWNWRDTSNQPANDPYYWATFESGSDTRAQLLFR